jgi:hypothetical protein
VLLNPGQDIPQEWYDCTHFGSAVRIQSRSIGVFSPERSPPGRGVGSIGCSFHRTRAPLSHGVYPGAGVDPAFIHALDMVGERFYRSEMYVPEMLRSARAMKGGMEMVKPFYSGAETRLDACSSARSRGICTTSVDLVAMIETGIFWDVRFGCILSPYRIVARTFRRVHHIDMFQLEWCNFKNISCQNFSPMQFMPQIALLVWINECTEK